MLAPWTNTHLTHRTPHEQRLTAAPPAASPGPGRPTPRGRRRRGVTADGQQARTYVRESRESTHLFERHDGEIVVLVEHDDQHAQVAELSHTTVVS